MNIIHEVRGIIKSHLNKAAGYVSQARIREATEARGRQVVKRQFEEVR